MHKTTEIQTSYRFLKSYFLKKKKKKLLVLLGGEEGQSQRRRDRQTDRHRRTDRQLRRMALFVSLISLVSLSFLHQKEAGKASRPPWSQWFLLGHCFAEATSLLSTASTTKAGISFPALNASPARLPLPSGRRQHGPSGLLSRSVPLICGGFLTVRSLLLISSLSTC